MAWGSILQILVAFVFAHLSLPVGASRFNGKRTQIKGVKPHALKPPQEAKNDTSMHLTEGPSVSQLAKATENLPEIKVQVQQRRKHSQETLIQDFVERPSVSERNWSKHCAPGDHICIIGLEARNTLHDVSKIGKWLLSGRAPFWGADFLLSMTLAVLGVGAIVTLVERVHDAWMESIEAQYDAKVLRSLKETKWKGLEPFKERKNGVRLDRQEVITDAVQSGKALEATTPDHSEEDEAVPEGACKDEWEPLYEAWEVCSSDSSDDDAVDDLIQSLSKDEEHLAEVWHPKAPSCP